MDRRDEEKKIGSLFSMGSLKVLDGAFMFFSRRASVERPEVPSLSRFGIPFL
jgi:hypothetical protein